MPLTDTFVKNARANLTPKKRSDGGGLHLLVTVQGSKLWRLSYRHKNKQMTLALDAYADDDVQEKASLVYQHVFATYNGLAGVPNLG